MTSGATDPQTSVLNRRLAKISDLKIDHKFWVNPRTFTGLSEQEIDEMAASIKEYGIEVSPHVVKVKGSGGTVFDLVIDGQRRVLGAMRVFDKDAEIEVVDLEPEPIDLTPAKAAELLERALNIGANRKGLSSYELSQAAETLRSNGCKLSQIARAIDKSETWVSKMLTARETAKPTLMLAWKKGEVTDEQFKELAKVPGDKTQAEAVKDVVTARATGDKAEARHKAKEIAADVKHKAEVRAEKREAKATNGHNHPPVVKGPQAELFDKDKPEKKEETVKPPPRAVLEDLVRIAEKKPPTHDYVKGLLEGVKYALGFTSPDKFARPWVTYLARVEGRAVAEARKERSAAKKAAKAKAAKARKPAKKSKKARRR